MEHLTWHQDCTSLTLLFTHTHTHHTHTHTHHTHTHTHTRTHTEKKNFFSLAHQGLAQLATRLDSNAGPQLLLSLLLAASGDMPADLILPIANALHQIWGAVGTSRWVVQKLLRLCLANALPSRLGSGGGELERIETGGWCVGGRRCALHTHKRTCMPTHRMCMRFMLTCTLFGIGTGLRDGWRLRCWCCRLSMLLGSS